MGPWVGPVRKLSRAISDKNVGPRLLSIRPLFFWADYDPDLDVSKLVLEPVWIQRAAAVIFRWVQGVSAKTGVGRGGINMILVGLFFLPEVLNW